MMRDVVYGIIRNNWQVPLFEYDFFWVFFTSPIWERNARHFCQRFVEDVEALNKPQ